MIENLLLFLTMLLWTSLGAYAVFTLLFSEDSRKAVFKKHAMHYLYFVMVFSLGSNILILGDSFWQSVFEAIAANVTVAMVLTAVVTWIVGMGLLVYLINLKEKTLG